MTRSLPRICSRAMFRLPMQSRSPSLNARASLPDPCVPPAPLPASLRRPACPARMPTRPAPLEPPSPTTRMSTHFNLALECQTRTSAHPASTFSLRCPACLSALRAAVAAGTASPDLRIAHLTATPLWSGAGRYSASRSSSCSPPAATFTVAAAAAARRQRGGARARHR